MCKILIKIPSISVLATNSALNAVQNKIPDVSNLVKKNIWYYEILDIESKYILLQLIAINLLKILLLIT